MNIDVYELLKRQGHDPAKAAEIELDARRGDGHAIAWIKALSQLDRARKKASAEGRE